MEAAEQLLIVGVDRIDGDQVMVEFSDHTQSLFTVKQLLSRT
jgi:hypothetical protein